MNYDHLLMKASIAIRFVVILRDQEAVEDPFMSRRSPPQRVVVIHAPGHVQIGPFSCGSGM